MRTGWLGPALLTQPAAPDEALGRIKNIVVIYADSRSFDHLYGAFPGANGLGNATEEENTQLDHDGTKLPYLVIFGSDGKPDPRFPQMPNGPFRIDAAPVNISLNQIGPSPIHAFYHNQEQINGMFARHLNSRRLRHGPSAEGLARGQRIHPHRQFLHGRIRRLVPQSSIPDLRLRAVLPGSTGGDACPPRCERQAV